jgi:hypothetical protein
MKAQVSGTQLAMRQVIQDDGPMPEDEARRWAAWLRDQLRDRPQKFLVDRGQGKISQGVVSKWLSAERRASPELAALVADIFGVDRAEALQAAGYDSLIPVAYRLGTAPAPGPRLPDDPEQAIRELPNTSPEEQDAMIATLRAVRARYGFGPDAPQNQDRRSGADRRRSAG